MLAKNGEYRPRNFILDEGLSQNWLSATLSRHSEFDSESNASEVLQAHRTRCRIKSGVTVSLWRSVAEILICSLTINTKEICYY
jgi:hypothetical protein